MHSERLQCYTIHHPWLKGDSVCRNFGVESIGIMRGWLS